ncbi:MAG TPA: hypothetical protein GX700_08240 [Paracoccus sp.]|nr:hypothetical protein [Paracoccus sp. (in: a-proteobacteria)]
MTKERDNTISRRSLFGVALGASAAATGLAAGGARPVLAQETGDERTRARYRVTEHVEAYYRTNRYYPRED